MYNTGSNSRLTQGPNTGPSSNNYYDDDIEVVNSPEYIKGTMEEILRLKETSLINSINNTSRLVKKINATRQFFKHIVLKGLKGSFLHQKGVEVCGS